MRRRLVLGLAVQVAAFAAGCQDAGQRDWTLPERDSIAEWFGEDTEVRLNGNVVEIEGEIDPEFLRRGGSLWAHASPYFYLFNVHVRDLVVEYPDVAAVRAIVYRGDDELARATLRTGEMSAFQWREALARSSRAQREGTEHPRFLSELVSFGEDHTEYEYTDD